MRRTRVIFIHSRILLALLGIVPSLVFAQGGSVEVPENARANSFGNGWECDKGYREVDETCLIVLAFANAGSAVTQPDDPDLPQPLIEGMVNELLDRLSASAEQIEQDRSVAYELSNELVVPYIDFPRITRLIIGKYWRDANDEQRQRLIDEISALLIRSYVTAMIAYADDTLLDEQFVYLPSRYQAGDRKTAVRAKISLDSGQTIDVRYAMYRTHDQWKIYDISFENISLVLTYRSSFGASIKNNGLDALITRLGNRNRKGEINLPDVVTKKMDESAAEDNKKDNH
jgi:phospholipid transport system substrate-binding protein